MIYCFDLDNTICATNSNDYKSSIPYNKVINAINKLYSENNKILIYTARGGTSKIDYNSLTITQLQEWGVKYHELIDKNKPHFDIFIEDKAINAKTWREQNNIKIVGFVASSFDLLHAGHCLYLQEAKSVCDYLIAGLQIDPTVDRPDKNKPVQTLEERQIQLQSTKYVDEIKIYNSEKDLELLLEQIKPDIRILGSDVKDKPITGIEHCKQIYYHKRFHNWSSSELRKRL
jgi:glycerol-3-phosphate cytidylyltransferase